MVITQDNSNNICKETIIQLRDNQTKTICYSAIKYCMKVKKRQITKFFTCFLWHLRVVFKSESSESKSTDSLGVDLESIFWQSRLKWVIFGHI